MKFKTIQSFIDNFRGKTDDSFVRLLTEKTDNAKNRSVKNLILGSSHMEYGYVSSDKDFYNLASANQDIYYTYNLYKLFSSENTKNVIFDFSVFSKGFNLAKTNSADYCALFKLLTGIDYIDKNYAKNKGILKKEGHFKRNINWCRKKYKVSENYNGCFEEYQFPTEFSVDVTAEERAGKHWKNHERKESMMVYLEKLLEETRKNNQNLIIVITPCTSQYKKNLPDTEKIYGELFKISSKYPNSYIINLYDDNEFSDEDFYDWDHLKYGGALKISEKITDFIRNNIK